MVETTANTSHYVHNATDKISHCFFTLTLLPFVSIATISKETYLGIAT